MARYDMPMIMSGELPRTVGETLDAIQLELLPQTIQQDPLAQWIHYDPLRHWNDKPRAYLRNVAQSFFVIEGVIDHVATQLIDVLTPYYQSTLCEIGQAWSDAEYIIAEFTSASTDEHLRSSMQLTRQRLEVQDELSPAARAILALARDTPGLFIEALRAELTDRHDAQVALLKDIRSCWNLWQQEVGRFQDSIGMLKLATHAAMDNSSTSTRDAATKHIRDRFNRAIQQLTSPTTLSERLQNVGLEAPAYPTEHLATVVHNARRSLDTAFEVDPSAVLQFAVHMMPGVAVDNSMPYAARLAGISVTEERNRLVTKRELSRRVAEKVGTSFKESEALVTNVLIIIREALADGDSVQLPGFGRFTVRGTPQTPSLTTAGSTDSVASMAHPEVEFTPGKDLAAAIEIPTAAPPNDGAQ